MPRSQPRLLLPLNSVSVMFQAQSADIAPAKEEATLPEASGDGTSDPDASGSLTEASRGATSRRKETVDTPSPGSAGKDAASADYDEASLTARLAAGGLAALGAVGAGKESATRQLGGLFGSGKANAEVSPFSQSDPRVR